MRLGLLAILAIIVLGGFMLVLGLPQDADQWGRLLIRSLIVGGLIYGLVRETLLGRLT